MINDESLQQLRDQIDQIDDQCFILLRKRAELVVKIAKIKQQQNMPAYYQPEREAAILNKILAHNDSLLPDQEIAAIFRQIMAACLVLQEQIKST